MANNMVQTYPDDMNQIPAPETEVAFRISPRFVKGTLRVLFFLVVVASILGGLALMSVADSPMVNSAGLVFALVMLMLVATALYLRREKIRNTSKHFVKNLTTGKHRINTVRQHEYTGARTLVQDLALLAQLHSAGQLTDAEFSSLKSKLLGS